MISEELKVVDDASNVTQSAARQSLDVFRNDKFSWEFAELAYSKSVQRSLFSIETCIFVTSSGLGPKRWRYVALRCCRELCNIKRDTIESTSDADVDVNSILRLESRSRPTIPSPEKKNHVRLAEIVRFQRQILTTSLSKNYCIHEYFYNACVMKS